MKEFGEEFVQVEFLFYVKTFASTKFRLIDFLQFWIVWIWKGESGKNICFVID